MNTPTENPLLFIGGLLLLIFVLASLNVFFMSKIKRPFWFISGQIIFLLLIIPFLFHLPILLFGEVAEGNVLYTENHGSGRTSAKVNIIDFKTPNGMIRTQGIENIILPENSHVQILYYPNDVYTNTVYTFQGIYMGQFSFIPFTVLVLYIIAFLWLERPFKN